ncbi:D-serine dehydratase [Teratosphaeria destructans]|uniref:D-serine dehydratase n=1 Tax=Teratosphaeria destructans TaxID=418781 RepID=A0A9W7T1H1_9PEZI|nr:D-serine dehydratase [Teratosphaeria destructans]
MDYSLEHHRSYIGKAISELPTPSLVLSLPRIKDNIARLHRDVEDMGIGFRAHVKTLKSTEVTKLMLSNGRYRAVVASTLAEIRGLVPLAQDGFLDECLYGLPVYRSVLPHLHALSKSMKILLMIDNEQHIDLLEAFATSHESETPPIWDAFIKVDVGSRRAGVQVSEARLKHLVQRAEASTAVNVFGFYAHAGHSYASRNEEDAATVLHQELRGVLEAASLLPHERKVVVSIGSTPTAHVVRTLKTTLPSNISLELHAGNFPANDLQQVGTGLVTEAQQAVRLCAEVCSVYPERNEAIVNAGVVALSRETGPLPGFAIVAGRPNWAVVRLSQEHGILGLIEAPRAFLTKGSGDSAEAQVGEIFKVGDQVLLYCQHACITAAAFHVYYVVDEHDVVVDTWVPWKGW